MFYDLDFLETCRPESTGMQCIPPTPFPRVSIPAGIVVTKSIKAGVPQRPVMPDNSSFSEVYPSWFYCKRSVSEVFNRQVLSLVYRSFMFPDPALQYPVVNVPVISHARPARDCSSRIDRSACFGDRTVKVVFSPVNQAIDPGTFNVNLSG